MDKVELTISMEHERMDALSFYLKDKGSGSVQKELEQALQELYEKHVPEETRRYIDSRCKIKPVSQNRTKKPIQKTKSGRDGVFSKEQEADENG